MHFRACGKLDYRTLEGAIADVAGNVPLGSLWKFLSLEGAIATLERGEHHINQTGTILGILLRAIARIALIVRVSE